MLQEKFSTLKVNREQRDTNQAMPLTFLDEATKLTVN